MKVVNLNNNYYFYFYYLNYCNYYYFLFILIYLILILMKKFIVFNNILGIFGKRIFGEIHKGSLLVVDYGVIKPSSSRHEDFVIHVYTESEFTTLDSKSIHTIGSTDQKKELLVGMFIFLILSLILFIQNSFQVTYF